MVRFVLSRERRVEAVFFHILKTYMKLYVPCSKLAIWEMAIPPSIGNPCNGYINPLLLGWWPSPTMGNQWGVSTLALAHIRVTDEITCWGICLHQKWVAPHRLWRFGGLQHQHRSSTTQFTLWHHEICTCSGKCKYGFASCSSSLVLL